MTTQQITESLMYLTTAFPTFKVADSKTIIKVWADQFGSEDGQLVQQAVRAVVSASESQFAPSIGEIKAMMRKLSFPGDLTEGEAWSMVERAITQSAYYAKEEFDKLPESVQRAVGSPSQLEAWARDENYNSGVVQSHFVNAYRQAEKQKATLEQLPRDIRLAIEAGLNGAKQIGVAQNG